MSASRREFIKSLAVMGAMSKFNQRTRLPAQPVPFDFPSSTTS